MEGSWRAHGKLMEGPWKAHGTLMEGWWRTGGACTQELVPVGLGADHVLELSSRDSELCLQGANLSSDQVRAGRIDERHG